jgi:hypothetical protein
MAAIAINTGEILYQEELQPPNYTPSFDFFASIEPKDVIGVIGTKQAIEEVSRLCESRAHLQALRVELERKERRLRK